MSALNTPRSVRSLARSRSSNSRAIDIAHQPAPVGADLAETGAPLELARVDRSRPGDRTARVVLQVTDLSEIMARPLARKKVSQVVVLGRYPDPTVAIEYPPHEGRATSAHPDDEDRPRDRAPAPPRAAFPHPSRQECQPPDPGHIRSSLRSGTRVPVGLPRAPLDAPVYRQALRLPGSSGRYLELPA